MVFPLYVTGIRLSDAVTVIAASLHNLKHSLVGICAAFIIAQVFAAITIQANSAHEFCCGVLQAVFSKMFQASNLLIFFASIVLSNDFDWMPVCLLLLHECGHVLRHVALVNKECALLEVNNLFGRNMPHCFSTKFLVLVLAGSVGICVCRFHPPYDRHLCLLPTCRQCWPNTLAPFC
jgi:hypothetical protein